MPKKDINDIAIWNHRPQLANLEEDNTHQTDWIRSVKHQLAHAANATIEDWIGIDEETEEPNNDFLDITFIINQEGDYQHVELLDTYGGPNCWLRTKECEYHLYWGGDHYSVSLDAGVCEAIDDHFRNYYESVFPNFNRR